jgi:hypothetical protein
MEGVHAGQVHQLVASSVWALTDGAHVTTEQQQQQQQQSEICGHAGRQVHTCWSQQHQKQAVHAMH